MHGHCTAHLFKKPEHMSYTGLGVHRLHWLDLEMAAVVQAGNPWRLLFSRGYRAELLVGASVAFFSQINGASWPYVCEKPGWRHAIAPWMAGTHFLQFPLL